MKKVGLCVDCKHYESAWEHNHCCHRQSTDKQGRAYSVITGLNFPERRTTGYDCEYERSGNPPECCGPFGQYWEPKP